MRRPLNRALSRPRLDAARPPLARLVRRDWIWRGAQALDGLFLPVPDGVAPAAAAAALAPFLPQAQMLRQGPDGLLALFAEPVALECGALGPCLPLKREHGALTGFPFAPPRSPDIAAAISDRLLLMRAGAPVALPLDRFGPPELSTWIDLDGISVLAAEAPPVAPAASPRTRALPVTGGAMADPQDADAGLDVVRRKVASAPAPRSIALPPGARTAAIIVAAVVALGVLAMALSGPGGDGSAILTLAASLLVGVALVALLRAFWRGAADDGSGAASGSDGGSGAGSGVRPSPWARRARRRSAGRPVSVARNRAVGGLALIVLLALGAVALQQVAAADSPGDALAALVGVIVAGLVYWLAGAAIGGVLAALGLGGKEAGPGTATGSPPARSETPPPESRPSAPGWLRRWLDRLLQHTPLSDRALGKYARRVAELERLFAEGRTDEALRKALAIDPRPPEAGPVRADLPTRGPGLREQIRIQTTKGTPYRALAGLPRGAAEMLEGLYRAQAEKCREGGDVDHAAFIHAELLGDAEAAVKCFADAGRFETAARLAQGRNLSPALFIPLWARAGAVEHALALAERHGAYDLVLNAADPEDEAFRDAVRRRWSERLASVGAHGEALRVSAPLVARDPTMRAARLGWMAEALARSGPDVDVIARALRAAPGPTTSGRPDAPLAAAAALMAAEGAAAARERRRLAERLLAPDFEPESDPAFARFRMPRLADQLPRRLLLDQTQYGEVGAIGVLRALAEAGGQSTLETDLRALPRREKPPRAPARRSVTVGAIRGAAAAVAATPLIGGRTLVGYEDGRIELLDRQGRALWQERVWKVRDFVSVAPGRLALILRDEPDGRRLSILDIDRLRHAEIGPVSLSAWAPSATVAGWLVHDGQSVRDLRTASLVAALSGAAPDGLEQNWATPITIEGEVLALARAEIDASACWLFRRADGAVEHWTVSASNLKVSYQVVRIGDAAGALATSDLTRFERIDSAGRLQTVFPGWLREGAPPGESIAPPVIVRGGRPLPDAAMMSPVRRDGRQSGPAFALATPSDGRSLELIFEGATEAWFRDGRHCETVALVDGIGRLAIVSTRTGAILHANAEIRETGP